MADLATVAEEGVYRDTLAAMRDSLAAKIDETKSGRDYAAMMKSMKDIVDTIYEYDEKHGAFAPKEEESPAAKARAELAEMERGVPAITRDMILFWVMTISEAVDTDALLDFVTEAMVDDAGAIQVAFILDQTKKCEPPDRM